MAAEKEQSEKNENLTVKSDGTPMRILLVEDSKFLRISTEHALSRAGYAMTSAVDGDEALRMARETIPDLILLDMLLPKLSGPDVLKALKADPTTKAIPVIVLTGMSERNAGRLRQDGAAGFIEKSQMAMDQGPNKLLAALSNILKTLPAAAAQAAR
jgi:CheY-like chemotaxis protein